jgi:hypothetical protein
MSQSEISGISQTGSQMDGIDRGSQASQAQASQVGPFLFQFHIPFFVLQLLFVGVRVLPSNLQN